MAEIKQINVGGTIYDIVATSMPEAKLTWGGKNFSGSYGPIDAAMVPELGANRLAFMPATGVAVHYSRDGGATWTDYGLSNSSKIDLFNGNGSGVSIGKNDADHKATPSYQARVTIYTGSANVYTVLNKFVIYVTTNGTGSNWCTIRARTETNRKNNTDTWTVFANKAPVSGWSGYNIINTSGLTTYGNTPDGQYGEIQFIFGCDTGTTSQYTGMVISKIFGYGGVGWTVPSTLAKTGHMYTYDSSKNVAFPAQVSASTFKNSSGTEVAYKGTATGGATPGTDSQGSHSHSTTVPKLTVTNTTLEISTESVTSDSKGSHSHTVNSHTHTQA